MNVMLLIGLVCLGQFGDADPMPDVKVTTVKPTLPDVAPKEWKIDPREWLRVPQIDREFYVLVTDDPRVAMVGTSWYAFDTICLANNSFAKQSDVDEFALLLKRGEIVLPRDAYRARVLSFHAGKHELDAARRIYPWAEPYPPVVRWEYGGACEVQFLSGPLKDRTAIVPLSQLVDMLPPAAYADARAEASKVKARVANARDLEAETTAVEKSKADAEAAAKRQRDEELRRTLEKRRERAKRRR